MVLSTCRINLSCTEK